MSFQRGAFRPWNRREFVAAGSLTAAGLALGCRPRAAGVTAGGDPLAAVLAELVTELERKVPYASALMMGQDTLFLSADNRGQSVNRGTATRGVVFSVWNGEHFEEAATSELDPDSLRATARGLAAATRVRSGALEIDPGDGGAQSFRTETRIDPRSLSLEDRFDRVKALWERLRAADPEAANALAFYSERSEDILFVNRAKSWRQEILRIGSNVGYFASDGAQTVSDFDQKGGTGGLELIDWSDDEIAALAAEARALLSAGQIEPGTYTVITDPSTSGTVAHESFGHGVELDMFVKDRALAEQYVGMRVGSELVEIFDDPSLPGAYGSYFFDHEGQPAASTAIVEKGIFRRGLSDEMSALTLGVERTANGRRQDYSRKIYARMSNTCFRRGTTPLDQLVGEVDHGYLLEKLTHGMEDPKGWGIQLGVKIGREIRNGKLTGKLVSPVGITGFVPEVLASVDGASDDFATDSGTCGKGHKESVPVSTGGPYLRFRAPLS